MKLFEIYSIVSYSHLDHFNARTMLRACVLMQNDVKIKNNQTLTSSIEYFTCNHTDKKPYVFLHNNINLVLTSPHDDANAKEFHSKIGR